MTTLAARQSTLQRQLPTVRSMYAQQVVGLDADKVDEIIGKQVFSLENTPQGNAPPGIEP